MNQWMFAVVLPAVLITSCQKKDDTVPDVNKVAMSVASPQPGQTFHAGDTVFIQATVTYPGELHGYEVKITDSSGMVVHDLAQHVHDDHFIINDKWVPAAGTAAALKLSITASIDHDGEDARKELDFVVKP